MTCRRGSAGRSASALILGRSVRAVIALIFAITITLGYGVAPASAGPTLSPASLPGHCYDASAATTSTANAHSATLVSEHAPTGGWRSSTSSLGFGHATKGASKIVEGARYPLSPKVQGQLGSRGWTTEAIDEAVQSGQQVRAINKATRNPATRHIHPKTGQSVVIDDVTGQVIHVGGPGFKYGPGSGDVP